MLPVGLVIVSLLVGPGDVQLVEAQGEAYGIPQCVAELSTRRIDPQKSLYVCTVLAASTDPGTSIAAALAPCLAVLRRFTTDVEVLGIRCVDVVYAAPEGVGYDTLALCVVERAAYGYATVFDTGLKQCAANPAANLSIAGSWASNYGPVEFTELDDLTTWVGTVSQSAGSTDIGGSRTGAKLSLVYHNRFDDDQGNGSLTLSDDGCFLNGSFTSDSDSSRRGPFQLQRCTD